MNTKQMRRRPTFDKGNIARELAMDAGRSRVSAYAYVIVLAVFISVGVRSVSASAMARVDLQKVKHIIGFSDAEPRTTGKLVVDTDGVVFETPTSRAIVPWSQIRSVDVASERVETGGGGARVVRFVLPYGGGSALGAVTQKLVGILTIGYSDTSDGLHSSLFILPLDDARQAQIEITSELKEDRSSKTHIKCSSVDSQPSMLRVVVTEGGTPAPEYVGLVYERLLQDIARRGPTVTVLRGTDESEDCKAEVITVTLDDVVKGNQAVRTVSGPVGMIVGVTRVRAHVLITKPDGTVELDQTRQGIRRGDRESLGSATSLADRIAKDWKKLQPR